MKVLLFTHGIDIDGFGCAILAKLAFGSDVDIVFADNFDLDEKIKERIKTFDKYDRIFVTDHCPSLDLCKDIETNIPSIKDKFQVLDHHLSRQGKYNQHPWVSIVVKNEKGISECGTSLFYKFLVENKMIIQKENLDYFIELTRLYDTWEWKNSQLGNEAYKLNTLFLAIGREKYIDSMFIKMLSNENWKGEKEEKTIENFLVNFNNQLDNYISKLRFVYVSNKLAGFVEILDLYKNDLAEKVRSTPLKDTIDFLLTPIIDRESVSLRNINSECDVSKIAEMFGGGGHFGAASFPKNNLPEFSFLNETPNKRPTNKTK